MTSHPPRTSRIDPVIEMLLIALLAFMPAALGVVDAWSEAVATVGGAAIALCLAVRGLAVATREARPSLAWAAVALFIAVAVAQLIPLPMSLLRAASPQTAQLKTELLSDLPDAADVLEREPLTFYPLATRHDLRLVLLATTVFAAVVTVYRDPARIRRLLAAVALIGGAFAALALAQDLSGATRIYWRFPVGGPARSGPFVNHSHYGQFMNLTIGCGLALLLARLTESHRLSLPALARRTAWLAAMIILALATIALSLTRGGMLSMLVSGAITVLMLLATRTLRQMAGVVLLLALGAMALVSYYGFDRVYGRLLEGGVTGRLAMVRDALDLVRWFPTAGVGLGAYEWIFPMFDRSREHSTAEYVENEYVQALADAGPLGLAAVLLFAAVILTRYFRAVRNHDDERIGLAAVGLGYGLFAVMVHSLTDFGQHLPAIACLSAVTCGLLYNLGRPRGGWTIRVGRGTGVAALIVVVATSAWALTGAARAWRAEQHWQRVRTMASDLGDAGWEGSDEEFDALLAAAADAIAAEPDSAYYRYWAALYRWHWVTNQVDPDTGATAVNDRTIAAAQRVVGELNEARIACPTFGLVYTLLGQIELKFLDRDIGYAHIDAGYRLSRNDAQAAFVAGQADARRGRFEAAAVKFQEALHMNYELTDRVIAVYLHQVKRPELASAALENNYYGLSRLRDELEKDEQWKDLAAQVHLRAVEALEAECKRPGTPAWKYAMLGFFRAHQQRHEEAERHYARALQLDPSVLDWRIQRANVLRKLGRVHEAIEEARLALRQHPDAPAAKELMAQLTGGVTP